MLGAKTRIQQSLSLASVLGTVLSLLGLLLPWGTLTWPPGVMGGIRNQVFGFEVLIGDFALAGCLLSSVFLEQKFSRPKQSVKFVFAGETVVAFFSLLWIFGSRYLNFVWTSESFRPTYYAPMYGTYVSFMGSLITMSAIGIGSVVHPRETSHDPSLLSTHKHSETPCHDLRKPQRRGRRKPNSHTAHFAHFREKAARFPENFGWFFEKKS